MSLLVNGSNVMKISSLQEGITMEMRTAQLTMAWEL